MINHVYSEEEKQFLIDNTFGRSCREVAELFNAKFGLQLSTSSIIGSIKRYGLKTGRDCRYSKGHESPNKGKKGLYFPGSEKGWFLKGRPPHNHDPVGTEKIKDDGYMWVKIAEPNKWRQKHRIDWEKVNGPLPPDGRLIFADGDRTNLSLDNLILLTNAELLTANRHGLIYKAPELTKAGALVAKLITKSWRAHREL
jgi:hypothetical protein